MRTQLLFVLSVMGGSTYFLVEGGATPAAAQDSIAAVVALPVPAPRDDSHGWEEAWRIRLSRGVGATPVWADSLLVVASLDRNLHIVQPGTEGRSGSRPRVVWEDGQKGSLGVSPIVLPTRIVVAESGIEGRLVAIDRSIRKEAWAIVLGDLAAQLLATDDRLYAVTSTGLVAAVSHAGVELWRRDLETRVVARPARLGSSLLVAAADGTLYALDPENGELRERIDPGAGSIWGDPALLDADHAIYATLNGQVFAVTPDLEVVARRSFPSSFYAGPQLDDGTLFLAGHEGSVWAYAWHASEIRWRRDLSAVIRAAPAVGTRAVAVGDLGGTLYQLDRESGELLWHARLDGAITSAPLVRDDQVYVGTEAGTLYAFRPTSPPSR